MNEMMMNKQIRRGFRLGLAALACIAAMLTTLTAAEPAKLKAETASKSDWIFYPYNYRDVDPDNRFAAKPLTKDRVEYLAKLGYGGVRIHQMDEMKLLEDAGLKACMFYHSLPAGKDGNIPAFRSDKSWLTALGRAGTIIAVASWHNGNAPKNISPDKFEQTFVAAIQDMADKCAPYGVRIALYPHAGHWLDKVTQAYELTGKIDRPNVGVVFNLFHHLAAEGPDNVEKSLRAVASKLWLVNINGAKRGGRGHDVLIQPLDSGDFDLAGLLALLREIGYRGPIGTHGVKGMPVLEQLERNSKAWTELKAKIK